MITFAGFNYPKFLGDLPTKPLGERLDHFKVSPKQNWLTGYRQDEPSPNPTGKSFYLESDFMPRLRWAWCDEIYSGIRHTGWFTDEYGDGDKVRGIVMALPHERGWLAGWSYGENMISFVEYEIYGDKHTAARRADRMAEIAADNQREADEKERQEIEQERIANCPTCKPSITYFTEQFKKHLKTPRTMSDGDTVKNCFQLLADDIRIHPLSPMLTGAEKQFELMLKSWLEFSIDCVDWDEIARELVDNVPA